MKTKTKTEDSNIVPPIKVFNGGFSFITNHTQSVPRILSSRKISVTSCAGAYLGATVSTIKAQGMTMKPIRNK